MLVPRAKLISRIESFVRGDWRSALLASRATLEQPLFVDVGIEEWGTIWSRGDHGLKFRCTWESCPQQDKRSNKVLQDRPDIQFVSKNCACGWQCPTVGAWKHLKRLGRCVKGRLRVVLKFGFQERRSILVGRVAAERPIHQWWSADWESHVEVLGVQHREM